MSFFRRHIIVNQLFAGFSQAGSCSIGTNTTGFQVLNPFFQWSNGYFIEFIHTNQEILRKNFCGKFTDEGILFFSGYFEPISGVYSRKVILTMIQIIAPFADIEVEDTYRINLFHLVVAFTQRNMFRNRFRHSVKDAFQII